MVAQGNGRPVDILDGPYSEPEFGMRDLDTLVRENQVAKLLDQIRVELLKTNPMVLTTAAIQGTTPIAVGDTKQHRILFEASGAPVTIYKLIAYSTYSGVVRISPASMANLKDGFTLSATPIVIHAPFSELYIETDGVAVCPVNQSADATAGGVYILGFTIPIFEQRVDSIPTVISASRNDKEQYS